MRNRKPASNRKNVLAIIAISLMLLALDESLAAQATAASKGAADVVALLEKSGYRYSKVSDGVWEILFKGNQTGEFPVRIALGGEILLVMTKIADRKELKLQPAMLTRLLELNDKFDTVKLALSDEMLYLRTDTHVRLIDSQEFKYLLEQVSGAVDETYPQIKQYLAGAK